MTGKGEERKEIHLTLYITEVFISLGLEHVLAKAIHQAWWSQPDSSRFLLLNSLPVSEPVSASVPCRRTLEPPRRSRIHPSDQCLVGGVGIWVYPS